MTYGAIIIDNRLIGDAIERHKRFLPESWPVIYLQPNIDSIASYNAYMTSRELWGSLPDKVLIFQADSGLLRTGIEEFLEWDYVGAPWTWQEFGGNGGLSLRSSKAMLQVIDNCPWDGRNEDHYFCDGLKALGLNLAPREICEKFSVEAIFKLGTIGYHAIEKYLTSEQVNQIMTQYD